MRHKNILPLMQIRYCHNYNTKYVNNATLQQRMYFDEARYNGIGLIITYPIIQWINPNFVIIRNDPLSIYATPINFALLTLASQQSLIYNDTLAHKTIDKLIQFSSPQVLATWGLLTNPLTSAILIGNYSIVENIAKKLKTIARIDSSFVHVVLESSYNCKNAEKIHNLNNILNFLVKECNCTIPYSSIERIFKDIEYHQNKYDKGFASNVLSLCDVEILEKIIHNYNTDMSKFK